MACLNKIVYRLTRQVGLEDIQELEKDEILPLSIRRDIMTYQYPIVIPYPTLMNSTCTSTSM